jgi:hypothetical protein
VRGAQVNVLALTGGVAVDIWPTGGRTRSSALIPSSVLMNSIETSTTTETETLSTFYSQSTRWIWLKFVPLDRGT